MGTAILRQTTLASTALIGVSIAVIWSLNRPQSNDNKWGPIFSTSQPGDIHQINIDHGTKTWTLVREQHKWSHKQHDLSSLQSEIDDLASLLVHTQVAPVLPAENASEYGLTSHSVTLTVYTHGGESKTLRIGDPTPDSMHDYVKMDDGIFLSRTRISLSVAATETALVNTMSILESELE